MQATDKVTGGPLLVWGHGGHPRSPEKQKGPRSPEKHSADVALAGQQLSTPPNTSQHMEHDPKLINLFLALKIKLLVASLLSKRLELRPPKDLPCDTALTDFQT